ncbi:MAG: T9SS type A sorting domain-containing protein [Bacteroidales bacterium]|nr:T9SS type A sorting domain-containing protein [Bacteroidales bacterium]
MKKTIYIFILSALPILLFSQIVLQEDFETANVSETPPANWICDADGWLAGEGNQSHGRESHSGDWYAYINWESDDWMYKEMNLEAGKSYAFSLWVKTDGNPGFYFETKWGTGTNPADMQHILFPVTPLDNDTYQEVEMNFTSAQTGLFYLGIHAIADTDPWYLCVDDILISTIEDDEFSINRTNADTLIYAGGSHDYLIEINNIGLNLDQITLSYSSLWAVAFFNLDGSGPISSIELQSMESATIIMRQSVPATGIDFGQTEQTIFTATSSNSTIEKSAIFNSTALTVYTNYPLIQGFEEVLFPPLGWDALIESGSKNFERTTEGEWPTCLPHDNSLGMTYYNSFTSQAGNSAFLVSPELALTNEEYILRFWFYRTDNIDNKADKIELYLSDDITLNNAELLGSIHRTISMEPVETTEGWFEYSFVFQGNAENKYIGFKAVSAYGWNMYIDDIKINENVADEEAPEFISINELVQYADLEMPIEMVIRDESAVTTEMQGIYNVGNGEEYFQMILVNTSKGDYTYIGSIPAQANETVGTLKFIMEDVYGNTAQTPLFDITWHGIAPLLEESFEGEFPPNGWTQIMQPYTWLVWQQVNEEDYTDSDDVSYVVTPPDGDYQAMVGWDWQENHQDEWLISPEVEITELADLTFETFARLGSYDYDHYMVSVSTNGGASWTEEWDAFYMDPQVIEYNETILIPLDNYVGQTIKVAWRAYNSLYENLWYSWFIDDVKIEKRTNVFIDEDIESAGFSFSVLQNPMADYVQISFRHCEDKNLQMRMINMNGNLVNTERIAVNNPELSFFTFNTSSLENGVYVFTVMYQGRQYSKRIMKIE